ncbi:PP2C family protein-serine/threonine phosphatase [Leisingera sp. S232]|uniref:PP2C family protein-serine/threonine phosphatase n=1 Tax=Leisingera sp. S232 TaxID=3415132 RepID=UPI00086AC202|nr:serine/threonine protein phosphatase [Rhodobacteraceae bacterium (ex Bugula neritina AB1)]
MWKSPEPRFDVAAAICQGARDYQEDAIITDFPAGTDIGMAVLADGMGGHAAGDVASKMVVTEAFSNLKFESVNFAEYEKQIPYHLTRAASEANSCVQDYVQDNPSVRGMGATLVSVVMIEDRLYWLSIGDSPLYLMRGGKLQQLNEDHSMAPQIDMMVKAGLLDEAAGRDHPDRNCLTSVILGDRVTRTDCPKAPFRLEVGDLVVVSSDGLQFLEDARIGKILHKYRRRKSAEIVERLLAALDELADPDQDNISFAVIKLNHNKPVTRKMHRKPLDLVGDQSATATRVVAMNSNSSDGPSMPEQEAKVVRLAGKGR